MTVGTLGVWLAALTVVVVTSIIVYGVNESNVYEQFKWLRKDIKVLQGNVDRLENRDIALFCDVWSLEEKEQEASKRLTRLEVKVDNMTNAEKYKDEIRNQGCHVPCAVNRIIDKRDAVDECLGCCDSCKAMSIEWLMKEYEEPPVDWSKVKPGTMVWVRDNDAEAWVLREFALYHDKKIWCYDDGLHQSMQRWNCAYLKGGLECTE